MVAELRELLAAEQFVYQYQPQARQPRAVGLVSLEKGNYER
jgi:hypothetical protein